MCFLKIPPSHFVTSAANRLFLFSRFIFTDRVKKKLVFLSSCQNNKVLVIFFLFLDAMMKFKSVNLMSCHVMMKFRSVNLMSFHDEI